MGRRNGFTLVELLVVVAIISMLVGITMPTLGRAKALARRGTCRGNLASVGKAMVTYATAHQSFPTIYSDRGGQHLVGAAVTNPSYGSKGNSCNMFALVRNDNIESRAFLCPSTGYGVDTRENPATDDDFRSYQNLGYSMHVQKNLQTGLRLGGDTMTPLMADRTPLTGLTSWAADAPSGGSAATPDTATDEGGVTDSFGDSNIARNSYNHEREGQNVVYRDGSCAWATTPHAGLGGDNIWTYSDGTENGSAVNIINAAPTSRRDAVFFP